jgi:hypothetical protein
MSPSRSYVAIVNGTFYITGTTTFAVGVEVTLSTGYSISNSPLMILAGTVNFNSGRMLFPSTLVLQGGRLAGADSMTVTGEVTLRFGIIQSSGVINAGSGFTIPPSPYPSDGDVEMFSGTLNNAGLAVLSGELLLGSNSVLNNLQGGTIQCFGTTGALRPSRFGDAGAFNNYGLFLKTGGYFEIYVPCNNYGEMDIQEGSSKCQEAEPIPIIPRWSWRDSRIRS